MEAFLKDSVGNQCQKILIFPSVRPVGSVVNILFKTCVNFFLTRELTEGV